ncbi:hypothetical protein L7F22_052030 [Adiantum nelumboides]|nr:hypothetical protein [Adiantum nelumboides]
MQSPKPMPNVQEQVAEMPIVQVVPVQPATFQQPIAGSNGQGSNLQAMQQVFPPPSVHPGYFGGRSVFLSMAGHAPGNKFYTPGSVFEGAQTMMPNPMYGGIGMQPGFQSTQSQFGMPQANFGMAGITNQQPNMTSPGQLNSGQGTQMNLNSVSMFQSLPYDNLTPLEKPTPYKEGGKGVTFTTFTGFDDRTKALSFLQQFDKAYAGGNFTQASKSFCFTLRGGFCFSEEDVMDLTTVYGESGDTSLNEGVEVANFVLVWLWCTVLLSNVTKRGGMVFSVIVSLFLPFLLN